MKNTDMIQEMQNGNLIIGKSFEQINSTVTFKGTNNILYCGENVKLIDSQLVFAGDNSVIYLDSNRYEYKLSVTVYNDCVFHMGKDNYINQKMSVILSEQKHCFIGDAGMFSINIEIRNADPHLIYSCSTGERLNITKSIYIGDHVWVGQDVRILKGTEIDSGSIIGAMSVVSNKRILHNSVWAGNPCKLIREDTFWDASCVHDWTNDKTQNSLQYSEYLANHKPGCSDDYWIYQYNQAECLEWAELENVFSAQIRSIEKYEYLRTLNADKKKNRFVHK